MATHRVYFGKGDQTLRTIAHRDGRAVRVTGATYAILDTRYGEGSAEQLEVPAGTAATTDPAATTLTARAGRAAADRRRLLVVSTATFLDGHTYLVEATDGRAETFKVAKVASATALLATTDLAGDYPSGSTVRGVELAATFPADAADDDANLDGMPWLLVWSLPDLAPVRESIHLERGEEAQLATMGDLLALDPALASIGGDRHELALALARAHQDFRVDLRLAGAHEADLVTGALGQDAVTYRAGYHALKDSNDEAALRRAEKYEARYVKILSALQTGPKKPEVTVLDKASVNAVALNPAQLFRSF